MSEITHSSHVKLKRSEERTRKLAMEKSYLQLVNNLMILLSEVPGVESVVDNILRLLLDNLGGSNVALYYPLAADLCYADVYGKRTTIDQIDDEIVQRVFASREFVEVEHDFAQTKMLTPEFTKASTWAAPLMVGNELVGVLKLEDMVMAATEIRKQLEPFFRYAALVLRNEISGYATLNKTYVELRETNAKLSEEIVQRKQAESSLRITQFAVDHASDSLFWITPEARFANVNDSACRRLGYSRDELLNLTVFELDPEFPREAWAGHWQEIKERKSFTIETKHTTKSGEVFPVEVAVNYVEYDGAAYNFAFARDITDRRRADDILRGAKEKLEHAVADRTLELKKALERLQAELEERKRIEKKLLITQFSVDNTADAVCWVRPDGSYAYANKSACRMFGYSNEEFLHLKTFDLNLAHRDEAWQKHWEELKRHGSLRFETSIVKKDGSPLLVEIMANRVEFEGQEINCAFLQDITERKRVEETLETERTRMEVILSALNTGLSLINPDMTIAWVNQKIREMFPGREPVGQVCHVFYESRATPCEGCGTLRAFMDGRICESEQLVPATGRRYSIISQPIKDTAGRVVNVLEGITDITERIRSEEEIRRSAREWSAAMDASEDVICLLDLERRVLRANKAFYRITRSTAETAIGRSIVELVHPGGAPDDCLLCRAQEEQRDLVFTMEPDHPHNPADIPFEIALRIVRDDAGRPISMLKTWHDLTHERKVQAELTAYREHLEELVRTRTAEIEKKKDEVERLNRLFVGRELRMIELKQKIKELEEHSEGQQR